MACEQVNDITAGALLRAAARDDLTWLNLGDALRGFGLRSTGWPAALAVLALRPAARRLAARLIDLDALTAQHSLAVGGAWICGQLAAGLAVEGPLPAAEGAVLVTANHPGLLDGAALSAAIGRRDLRILAIARPFLRTMPAIRAALIDVGETAHSRMRGLRAALRHLQQGGALLTFPAGRIEADPRHDAAAAQRSLAEWHDSLATFARLAPQVPIVPALVSGVLAPQALRHPLLRLRSDAADRAWLAAILQLLPAAPAATTVRVRFGAAQRLPAAVLAELRSLIAVGAV